MSDYPSDILNYVFIIIKHSTEHSRTHDQNYAKRRLIVLAVYNLLENAKLCPESTIKNIFGQNPKKKIFSKIRL